MQLLHVDRVDPQSIDGIVEDSIASQLRSINSVVAGVVSTLASIGVAQQSSAARFAKLHDAVAKQHSMLMTMVDGNTARDAQLAQHGERMARVERIFEKVDQQLPSLVRCIATCSEFGPTAAAVASTLNEIRDHTVTVPQRLDDMEETIRDTILDLKVDVISTTLASLELVTTCGCKEGRTYAAGNTADAGGSYRPLGFGYGITWVGALGGR